MRAAVAMPEGSDSPVPGVLVLHEVFGLNDDMRRKARRLADMGYAAIAPDLLGALGRRPGLCMLRIFAELRFGIGSSTFANIARAQEYLGRQPGVDPSRTAAIGFCLGGGYALIYAHHAGLQVAAPFYGHVPRFVGLPFRRNPFVGNCNVLGGFGRRDRVYGAGGERLRRHLRGKAVDTDIVTYPDAGHSYMTERAEHGRLPDPAKAFLHVAYNKAAAEDSWRRINAFFAKHLGKVASE